MEKSLVQRYVLSNFNYSISTSKIFKLFKTIRVHQNLSRKSTHRHRLLTGRREFVTITNLRGSGAQYGIGIDLALALTRAWAGILKYGFFISNLNFTRYQWIHLVNFNVSSTLENYFEACKTFQYLQNFKKGIMVLQAIQDTSKDHRKLF